MAFASAAFIFVLTACGADTDLAGPASTAPAPAVIEIAGGVSGAASAAPQMADAAEDSTKMMAAYLEYLYSGDVPDLTAPAASWFFPADVAPDTDQIAALAAALGVEGDVRELGAEIGGGWTVGPDDYSGPSVTVSSDALQGWWFSPCSAANAITTMACEYYPAGDPAGGGTDATAPVCAEPEPPANVPTADEAQVKAVALFESLGVLVDAYDFETYADEWSASVTGYLTVDGVRTTMAITAGYGAEGVLTWANGFLATPERGADYPRIGVEAAVQRLNDQQNGMWATARGTNMTGYGDVGPAAGEVSVEPPVTTFPPAAGPAPAPGGAPTPTPAATTTVGGATSGSSVGSSGSASSGDIAVEGPITCDPAADCIEPMPGEMPVDAPPAEPMVVTLTAVRASLEQVWAADETVWLLPGYAFESDDQGLYSVIAIEDQYLAFADPAPVPMPEPMPAETVPVPAPGPAPVPAPVPDGVVAEPPLFPPDSPVPPVPGDPVPGDVVDLKLAASTLVGLSEADAAVAAKVNGWVMRVVSVDGENLAATADYSPSRVNVAVESGTVTEAVSIG